VRIRFLGKHTLFRRPFGWFFRMLGGIPVDRSHPGGIINQVTAEFARREDMILVIAPEGTRSHRPYWRSGFYEIARATGVPIVLAALDAASRRVRIGPTIETTGDVTADMDRIRGFFAQYQGIKPEQAGVVRLKAEDER
jgi:1-acyl-sn-glycerol-3-phosphate acyltransferase